MTDLSMLAAGCGFFVAMLGTLAGIGGGALMVPILRVGLGVPMHQAVACSLTAIFPAAFLTTVVNIWRGRVDFRLAVSIEVAAACLAVAGAYATHLVSAESLRWIFGGVIGVLGVRLLLEERARAQGHEPDFASRRINQLAPFLEGENQGDHYRVSVPGSFSVGGVAGFFAGMLGIGGGFLKTPALIHGFGVPARVATATSLATVAVTACIGSYTHYRLGHLDLELAQWVVLGFVSGAIAGNIVDRKVEEALRRKLVAINLVLAGLVMLLAPGS